MVMNKESHEFAVVAEDNGFLINLLRNKEEGRRHLNMAKASGFRYKDHLRSDYHPVWEFVDSFFREYGELPTVPLVVQRTGWRLGAEPDGPFKFSLDNLFKRRRFDIIREANQKERDALNGGDVEAAATARRVADAQLRVEALGGAQVERFGAGAEEVRSYYEKIERGEFGIPLPWKSIMDATMGLWPGDVGLIVARPGTGKTWSAILFALVAWAAGYKVLFVTTEMSKLMIRLRFYAMHKRIPYGKLRRAKLTPEQKADFYAFLEAFGDDDRIHLIGGQFDANIETLDAAVDSHRPDLVVVDGAYLLRIGSNNKLTPVENDKQVMNEAKRIMMRYQCAGVLTTQYNRNAAAGKKGAHDTGNIAGTDSAGQNATWAFGLGRTPEQKLDDKMEFTPIKMREDACEAFESHWNFVKMDFTEVETFSYGEDAATPSFDTGVPIVAAAPDGGLATTAETPPSEGPASEGPPSESGPSEAGGEF